MGILTKIFGDPNDRELKRIQREVVAPVNALEEQFKLLTDDQLQQKTLEFKQQLTAGDTLDSLLVPAFATVREAARRVLGQRHFDVQLIGGYALCSRRIAEMRTGEGKTLTSTLAIYFQALAGKGVHVVTVNDYLAKRDACWMGQVYAWLGLSIGIIQNQGVSFRYDPANLDEDWLKRIVPCSRREAYACDIIYGTNNEFGFDYLRDNMVVRSSDMVQRELYYAVVDEIDSILIDEARTPLIISTPAEESTDRYYQFAKLVQRLRENEDYNVDEKQRTVTLTEPAITKLEQWLNVDNIYVEGGMATVHHIEQALKAFVLFKRDRDYVVQNNNEVVIVDEFTGRLMPGRRYSEGLHQAIEAKENVTIQRESQTLATITFQNYFRMYQHLAGMTGTALTEAEEFGKIYNLDVLVIPPNRPMVRRDLNDQIYKNERGKFSAVVAAVKELHHQGQPVLIGTISIEKNELLSELLMQEGIAHEVLNAKQHEREAEIIAQAGRRGAVTLATNMAGRGVDIILGGKPPHKNDAEFATWQAEHEAVKAAGGLAVLGTERHESRRIDNQLRGRSGRQGDPGLSRFYLSLEDDLMRIFGPDRLKGVMEKLQVPDDMPIENKLVTSAIASAQKRVEGHNFDIRKHLVEYDDVMNKQRETIYRRRRQILEQTDELKNVVLGMIKEELTNVVNIHAAGDDVSVWNIEEIYEVANSMFGLDAINRVQLGDIEELKTKGTYRAEEAREALVNYLFELSVKRYNAVTESILTAAPGVPDIMRQVERGVLLRSIDTLWVEHLDAVGYMRQGIGLRGYGQRDPLLEYKKEAYLMFKELLNIIRQQSVFSIFKVGVVGQQLQHSLLERQGVALAGANKNASNAHAAFGEAVMTQLAGGGPAPKERDAAGNKVGRNDPCPCGSGKKYKKCHGA